MHCFLASSKQLVANLIYVDLQRFRILNLVQLYVSSTEVVVRRRIAGAHLRAAHGVAQGKASQHSSGHDRFRGQESAGVAKARASSVTGRTDTAASETPCRLTVLGEQKKRPTQCKQEPSLCKSLETLCPFSSVEVEKK